MAGKTKKDKEAGEKGKMNIDEIRSMLNKKAGTETCFDLEEESPTEVDQYISTGSHVLDCLLIRGKKAGFPVSKISYVNSLSSAGKSFAMCCLCAEAQKMGIRVAYFDSENALDPQFLKKAGANIAEILYIQATSIEYVFETIEELLSTNDQWLFILDSYAACPCKAETAGGYNPQESVALKPRITGLGLKKLTIPIANKKATLVVTNHLITNIVMSQDMNARVDAMLDPFIAPGGKNLQYYSSLTLNLTGKKNKASFLTNESGHVIGTETKVKIKKSRFGTLNREIMVKLVWGEDKVRFADEESWFDILKESGDITTSTTGWSTLTYEDGADKKFHAATILKELEDPKFKNRIMQQVEKYLIDDFADAAVDATKYYSAE